MCSSNSVYLSELTLHPCVVHADALITSSFNFHVAFQRCNCPAVKKYVFSITNPVREEKNVLKHFMIVYWFITHLGRQGKKSYKAIVSHDLAREIAYCRQPFT